MYECYAMQILETKKTKKKKKKKKRKQNVFCIIFLGFENKVGQFILT